MVTIDIKQLLIYALMIAGVILLLFLIVAISNLITTLKKVNGILDDTSAVTKIVHEKAEETKPAVDDLTKAILGFARSAKGNENAISSLSNLAKSLSSMVGIIRSK